MNFHSYFNLGSIVATHQGCQDQHDGDHSYDDARHQPAVILRDGLHGTGIIHEAHCNRPISYVVQPH